MAVAAVVVVVVALVAVADVKAEATVAEDAKAANVKAMAVETNVMVEIAAVVSGISQEEAVKTEVLENVKAEAVATEDAGLNLQRILY